MFEKMKAAYELLRHNIRVYTLVMKDPRTPRVARWLLWLSIGYLVSPLDIIPDFIPVIGLIDDVIIVPTLFLMAKRMIPPVVIEDARKAAAEAREKRKHHKTTQQLEDDK
jgi:uncharacterized membrane protein YkvA (DUF1232 family)